MRIFARILSWIFIPLFAPIYALLLALYIPSTAEGSFQFQTLYFLAPDSKYFFTYVFITFSAVFPIMMLVYFKLSGLITSFELPERRERYMPAIAVNISGVALYILLKSLDKNTIFPPSIYGLVLGSLIAVLISTVITWFWKISLHAIGMGVISGFIFAYYFQMVEFPELLLPALIVLSGIVLSARHYLKLHDLKQLFAGYFLGFIVLTITVLCHN